MRPCNRTRTARAPCLGRCPPPRARATNRPLARADVALDGEPQREIEQRAKALFERCVALDLAANITDDAAKPRAQKLQFSPRAFELVGMRVAPHHDGGTLGQAQIALAQLNALALGQLHQLLVARWVSQASVGCAIALSWTVVSIATRSRSLVSIAPVRWATERLSCNSAEICSSPSRWRQRVSDERSNGNSCRNTTSPQKYWKYGFSTHRSHSASSERLCICLRMNSPATSRVGNGGCPGPTRHTELKRRARKSQSISPASRTSGWRKLMIFSRRGRNRSSWRSSRGWLIGLPPTANLAVEGITDRPNQESQTARKPACTPGFLAKSITCSGQIIAIDQSLPHSSRTTS